MPLKNFRNLFDYRLKRNNPELVEKLKEASLSLLESDSCDDHTKKG